MLLASSFILKNFVVITSTENKKAGLVITFVLNDNVCELISRTRSRFLKFWSTPCCLCNNVRLLYSSFVVIHDAVLKVYIYTVRCLFSLRVRSASYSRSSVRCWPPCFTLWIRSSAPTPVKYAKRISRKEEREQKKSKKKKNRWPCCFCVSPGKCRWFFIKERKMIAHSLCTSRSLQKQDIWKESVTGYCHLEGEICMASLPLLLRLSFFSTGRDAAAPSWNSCAACRNYGWRTLSRRLLIGVDDCADPSKTWSADGFISGRPQLLPLMPIYIQN